MSGSDYFMTEEQAKHMAGLVGDARRALADRMKLIMERAMYGSPTLVRHFKGELYIIEDIAYDCDDLDRKMVIYSMASTGTRFVRPLIEFYDLMPDPELPGMLVPRFSPVDVSSLK